MKTVFLVFVLVLLSTLAFNIQPAKASGTIYIRADGSIDPPTAPISTPDTVTYTITDNVYESIAVERDNIIVDGAGYTLQGTGIGIGIDLTGRSNVTIKNMNISALSYGIYISSSSNNTVSGNNLANNSGGGIVLFNSLNNSISGNNMANNMNGIILIMSSNNIVSDNIFTNDGLAVAESYSNVVEGNMVNGEPLVYLEDVSGYTVGDAGQVILVNCTHITVENLNLSHTAAGVQLWGTTNTTIAGNNITNNGAGIYLWDSSNHNSISGNSITANDAAGISLASSSSTNISGNKITNNIRQGINLDTSSSNLISGNNITNNGAGIRLWASSNNRFYHNRLIDNTQQVYIGPMSYGNVWDDGYPFGGNYWSDYEDRYPEAEELDGSGLWDTPYVIDDDNQDNYPIIPEFPTWASILLILVVPSVAIVMNKRRLKTPIH